MPSISSGMSPPSNNPEKIAGKNFRVNCRRREAGWQNCPSVTPSLRSSATAVQLTIKGMISHTDQKNSDVTLAMEFRSKLP